MKKKIRRMKKKYFEKIKGYISNKKNNPGTEKKMSTRRVVANVWFSAVNLRF